MARLKKCNTVVAVAFVMATTGICPSVTAAPARGTRDFFRSGRPMPQGVHDYCDSRPADYVVWRGDTIRFEFLNYREGRHLVERDYREVARKLAVDVASIKAVVDVETGHTCRGFGRDDRPIVNFNINVFRTMLSRRNMVLDDYRESHPGIFELPDSSLLGTQQRDEYARYLDARRINAAAAVEATFWGMFQIGGFNWKRCGVSSAEEFARLMATDERQQLELFASFLKNSGLLPSLQQRNWKSFARGYNGPSYRAFAYDRKLEAAYDKYSVNRR